MATAAASNRTLKEYIFEWEGKDRSGKTVRGEVRAAGENQVQAALRRQGVLTTKIKKRRMRSGKAIKPKDIAIFTRQLATMMKAGVPLLQAFDIVGRGNANPSVAKLLNDIRSDVETGTSLSAAFRKFPKYFDNLYCNLVEAGEAAGILEDLLDRLATYMEKTEAIKSKIKSALMYPTSVVVVAFVVVAIIMIFVIPAFKQVFTSFGADLPAPTLIVMGIERILRLLLVADLRRDRWRHSTSSSRHGSATSACKSSWTACCLAADFRHAHRQVVRRALDAHTRHHVCRRRPAGRSARFGGRRLRQLGLCGSDDQDPAGSVDRDKPDHGNDQCQPVPFDGACR